MTALHGSFRIPIFGASTCTTIQRRGYITTDESGPPAIERSRRPNASGERQSFRRLWNGGKRLFERRSSHTPIPPRRSNLKGWVGEQRIRYTLRDAEGWAKDFHRYPTEHWQLVNSGPKGGYTPPKGSWEQLRPDCSSTPL